MRDAIGLSMDEATLPYQLSVRRSQYQAPAHILIWQGGMATKTNIGDVDIEIDNGVYIWYRSELKCFDVT